VAGSDDLSIVPRHRRHDDSGAPWSLRYGPSWRIGVLGRSILLVLLALGLLSCERGAPRDAAKSATQDELGRLREVSGATLLQQQSSEPGARGDQPDVAPFRIEATEVTLEAYERCVIAAGCTEPHDDWEACNWSRRKELERHPVNCIDWYQATAYCTWSGRRLPTEAEWEAAARGSDDRIYPWGNDGPAKQLCWEGNPEYVGMEPTCPVGSYPAGASPFGVLDMAGSVWEWTSGSERLPDGTLAYSLRGGGWSYDGLSPVVEVRIVDRELHPPEHHASDLGFRCAAPSSD